MMKSVLTVINDELLMSRVRIALSDETIKYFYASGGDEAARFMSDNEISVAVIDYRLPVINGQEMCEVLLNINPRVQIVLIFDEKDTAEVLNTYNRFHINKLICKNNMVLEDLPKLIDSCLHIYNRDDELAEKKASLSKISERYMKPLSDMSDMLNERMNGYQEIIRVYCDCIRFISGKSDKALKPVSVYVDRIINDYIQLYMVREPDFVRFLNDLNVLYNKPSEKKYFKCVYQIDDDKVIYNKKDLLFATDILTIGFDSFFSAYRGKMELFSENDYIILNVIYEIREDENMLVDVDTILKINYNLICANSYKAQYARNNNLIQYKISFLNKESEG